ncbi:MAG: hypothetical protein ABEJ36_03580 [Candidatus Nanosalina sp.]
MNPIQLLSQLGELGTAGLLLALVLLFVVAFKLLEMVFQTITVSALSGAFYFALSYYLDSVAFSLNSLLFFAFIGGSLYTGYYLVIQGYGLITTLAKIPIALGRKLVEKTKKYGEKISENRENSEENLED